MDTHNMDSRWLDSSLPFEERVDALVEALTLEEKTEVLSHASRAVERLGVPDIYLSGFERVSLRPGETKEVKFSICSKQLPTYRDDGEPCTFQLTVGGTQLVNPHRKLNLS